MKIPSLIFLSFLYAQTEPIKDIHQNNPRVWALTHAMVFTEPGDSIKDGTIIIRDGKVDKVGRYIQVPFDAFEIDMKGANIYPGFIDGWLKVKKDEKIKSPDDHWNEKVHAEYRAKDDFLIKDKDLASLHSLGMTYAHIVPDEGIIKGKSDLILLDKSFTSLSNDIAQIIEFKSGGWSDRGYPNSLLGVIALLRQTFHDTKWYTKSQQIIEKYPAENEPLSFNPSFQALSKNMIDTRPVLFMTQEEHAAIRSLNIAKEFSLLPWLFGSGYEYRRLNEIKEQKPFIIFPLDFPGKPKVASPYDAIQYSTEQLQHWEMAPDNIKKVYNAGMNFSLTTSMLKNKKDFRNNLQRMIDRGLSKDILLAALTTFPAEAMGVGNFVGKIQPGYMANLVVTDGDYFDPKSRVNSIWIAGEEKFLRSKVRSIIESKWELLFNNKKADLEFLKEKDNKKTNFGKIKAIIKYNNETLEILNLENLDGDISFSTRGFGFEGMLFFNGKRSNGKITGEVFDRDKNKYPFTCKLVQKEEEKNRKKEITNNSPLYYPAGSYGQSEEPLNPNAILINDATIWTSGPKGKLVDWDILFVNGKIDKVAPDISVPLGSALIIDGTGKHVTAGLIDCHSHSAASSINEGAQAVTAEVRIKDVLFSDDINIYRQLGGGLTTANILHGSANPIGGQNAVIKLRWGSGPDGLLFRNAPQGIKFALGENVKQANWEGTNRYPQTRMGVEQIIRDAFRAAQDYRQKHKTYERNTKAQRKVAPPRIDLELEAIAEILEGKRLVHCHSYRQDEILMLTRIAEDFGFRIATFQHVLEGYKVAERIAEHGAGASTFSDWWQYKYEVIDAIPYNGAIMSKNDVLVSFNSDDSELARRLNTEAAKAIKYGDLSEEEALKFVTINPAKQLHIDDWVGSLEEGKDADFVIWDGPPLSIYSKVEETWIEGKKFWSIDNNLELEERDQLLRENLIKTIMTSKVSSGRSIIPNIKKNQKSHNCELIDEELLNWESR